ncbi:MAG: hypothetical protein ACJ72E_08750 [Marmoricola sp.]
MTTLRYAVGLAALALLAVPAPAWSADPGHPSGTFTVEQHPAWLSGTWSARGARTTAEITVDSLTDDATPSNQIDLRLDVASTEHQVGVVAITPHGGTGIGGPGTTGWTVTFSFRGTFVPTVTMTDGDGNQTTQTLPAITVAEDSTPPVTTIALPAAPHRFSAWRTIRGISVDRESAIREVELSLYQRRAGVWYSYDGRRRTWLRGDRNEISTMRYLRGRVSATTFDQGRWSIPVARLTKGLLVIRGYVTHDSGFRYETLAPIRISLTRR